MELNNNQKIIFYDGTCLICNRAVNFLLEKDRRDQLLFMSLNNPRARDFIVKHLSSDSGSDTVVFYDNGRFYFKSGAILRALYYLGPPFYVMIVFKFIPRKIRDWLYDKLAKNRYKWFGRTHSCVLPDEASRKRILG